MKKIAMIIMTLLLGLAVSGCNNGDGSRNKIIEKPTKYGIRRVISDEKQIDFFKLRGQLAGFHMGGRLSKEDPKNYISAIQAERLTIGKSLPNFSDEKWQALGSVPGYNSIGPKFIWVGSNGGYMIFYCNMQKKEYPITSLLTEYILDGKLIQREESKK